MAMTEASLPQLGTDNSLTTFKILSPRGKACDPSPAQRMVIELSEQLQSLKEELDAKENAIAQLRGTNISLETELTTSRHVQTSYSQKLEMFCKELCEKLNVDIGEGDLQELVRERISRLTLEKDRLSSLISSQRKESDDKGSDMAALRVKLNQLTDEIRSSSIKNATKEEQINDLRSTIGSHQEQEARLGSQIEALNRRVAELEASTRETEETQMRYEVSLASAKKDVMQKEQSLDGLSSKLAAEHSKLSESDTKIREINKSMKKWEERYLDLSARMRTCLQMAPAAAGAHDEAINKIVELVHCEEASREKVQSLEKSVHTHELEAKANRETIMRLVAECSREKQNSEGLCQTLALLQKERDMTMLTKRELQQEVESVTQRLNASTDALEAVRSTLHGKEEKLSMVTIALDTQSDATKMSDIKHQQFVEEISAVLASGGYSVNRNEGEIRGALETFVVALNNTKVECSERQREIERLKNMLATTEENAAELRIRAAEATAMIEDKEKQYSGLEGELLAGDAVREGLRKEKQRLNLYLEELGTLLCLDSGVLEAGIELKDAVQAKCEQLVNNEGALVKERTSALYNAQRKIKVLKQQAEQKELHMSLQRQKVSALEERISRLTQVEDDRDQGYIKLKKAQRNVEKFSTMINEKTVEITELKATLHDKARVEERLAEATNKVTEFERQVQKVKKMKEQLKGELEAVQGELRDERSYLKSHKELAKDSTTKLKHELTETMRIVEESRGREKQLLEFRSVLAKVIGLDISQTAVPDYEIISRLEKLVEAHQSHLQASQALEAGLRHMATGFRSSYDETMSVLSPLNKEAETA